MQWTPWTSTFDRCNKKRGVEVVSFSMESWEICLKKTVDVLKFSIKFKFQFSVWMTLPNLRFDNSFWPFQRILISFNFGCLKYEFVCDGSILIRLVNCGNVQDLVKSVVVAGGTSMLLNLAPRLRSVWLLLREKNALRNSQDFEVSWISSRLAKRRRSWDTVKQWLK